ncbi:putative transposon-derived protein F52C9.6 [Aphis craccivora]|uniref:Putative transposon-derived protein F52C9.6 n=1 Tax=Aphis craccivora TaxID=307492 RepID=A0A6G0ZH70_APHCR|nr:putative transposon-derived protein F52C9.6 [Aphis craccivora]
MERKIKLIGHLNRHNDFLNKIFEERIMGRRPIGKPRVNYFHGIKEKIGCASYQQL